MSFERCIVNVATGRYCRGQQRLREALAAADEPFRMWSEMPRGCPPHEQMPYAFKAYAMEEARQTGAELIMWLDASILPIRDLEPIWLYTKQHGVWLSKNWWNNYVWTADAAYGELFPEFDIATAREVNKTMWHVAGTAFCVDVTHPAGKELLNGYIALACGRAFAGPWWNKAYPDYRNRGGAEVCGPPDVLGHRHDQTALSVLAWRAHAILTDPPRFFAYAGVESSDTVLMADGTINR